jgi:antitoxin (DNA-binding transcriptional repressor) of toxin-antitoxin stability system
MEEIAVSKFKATCLAVLQRVHKTRKPILITRFGKPIAEVVPPPPPRPKSWLGCMAGTGKITGDIIAPAAPLEEWDVFHQ